MENLKEVCKFGIMTFPFILGLRLEPIEEKYGVEYKILNRFWFQIGGLVIKANTHSHSYFVIEGNEILEHFTDIGSLVEYIDSYFNQ